MTETIDKWKFLDYCAGRFEDYVIEYHKAKDDVTKHDRKYSAYELSRIMYYIDEDVGKEAVHFLRENDL